MRKKKKSLSVNILGKIRKNFYSLLLLLLCTILLISHTLYVIETRQYPEQDEHVYLEYAVQFYDILSHPTPDILNEINKVNPNRQPFYGLILALPLLLLGTTNTYKLVLWLNVIWYLLTIVGIYFLGKEFLSRKASLLAAYIFAFSGFPLFYLHFTYSETFVTFLIVFCLLFLARTDNFRNKKYVILFSLFFSIANLSRWVVPLFVGGPLFLTLSLSLIDQYKKKSRNLKRWLINLGIFIALGILPILLFYYIPNFSNFKEYVSGNVDNSASWINEFFSPELQGLRNRFSPQSVIFYFNIISQQTIFFLLLFIIGCVMAILHIKKYAFLFLGFFIAYAAFTFGSILKFDRYIVPIYPFVALISAVTFDHIKKDLILKILIGLTVILGFLNFLGGTWGIGPMKFSITGNKDTVPHSILLTMPIGHPRRVWFAPISWPPKENELNAEETFTFIEKDTESNQKPAHVILAFIYYPFQNGWHKIVAYEKRDNINYVIMRSWDKKLLKQYIKTTEYILIKDKNFIDKEFNNPESKELYQMGKMVRNFNSSFRKNGLPPSFRLVKKISIPLDNTNILIYKKTKKMSEDQLNTFLKQISE